MPTQAQVRKIWASARELGLDEGELRALVEDLTGSSSLSSLTFLQARNLIDTMVRMGATPGPGTVKPSGRRTDSAEVKLMSGPVRDLIADLRQKLGGKWVEDPYFEGACKRLIRRPRPRTGAEGARVIEMLKKRLAYEAEMRREDHDPT